MHKYRKAAMNIALITIIFTAGLTSSALAAFTGQDADFESRLAKPDARQERVIKTLEDADYESWKKTVGKNNKIVKIIDENSFQKFIEARSAARQGEYDKAIKITEALKGQVIAF